MTDDEFAWTTGIWKAQGVQILKKHEKLDFGLRPQDGPRHDFSKTCFFFSKNAMAPAFNAESRRHSHEYRTKANGAISIFSDNLKFLWARGGLGCDGRSLWPVKCGVPKKGRGGINLDGHPRMDS